MLKDLCFEVIQTCPNKCKFCSSKSSKEKKTIITLEQFKKNINGIEQQEKIWSIINGIKKTNNNENKDIFYIVYIKYSDNWYIAVDKNSQLHVYYTEEGKEECKEELQMFKHLYDEQKEDGLSAK